MKLHVVIALLFVISCRGEDKQERSINHLLAKHDYPGSFMNTFLDRLQKSQPRENSIQSFEPKIYYPVPLYAYPEKVGAPKGIVITAEEPAMVPQIPPTESTEVECCQDRSADVRSINNKLRLVGLSLLDLGHYLTDDDAEDPLLPGRITHNDNVYGWLLKINTELRL